MPTSRRVALVLAAAFLTLPAGASQAVSLDGTWIGNLRDGTPTVWQMDTGRLRRDGRPADYETHGDSLVVRFDAPGENDARETAVYRFYASDVSVGQPRLFLYGFDLGKQGVHLVREREEKPPLAEDTSPEPPTPPSPAPSAPAPPTHRP
jgi:hypothetical protein